MMRTMAMVVATLVSCGPSSGGTDGLQTLEVQPANATVMFGASAAQPVDYTAIGHYADGHTETLADVVFSLDNDAAQLGTLTQAEFAASGAVAGTGTVTATSGTASGSTGVSVI